MPFSVCVWVGAPGGMQQVQRLWVLIDLFFVVILVECRDYVVLWGLLECACQGRGYTLLQRCFENAS